MMYKHGTYNFLHDKVLSCSVVEVPYPDHVAAWFILPEKGKLRDLVKEDLKKWGTSFESG